MSYSRMISRMIEAISEIGHFSVDSSDWIYVPGVLDLVYSSDIANHFLSVLSNLNQDTSHLRLIVDGKDVHPASFYDARIGDGLIVHSQLRDRVVNKVLLEGGTVVIDHVNDISPVARGIQEFIESYVSGVCWVQCYITKSTFSAFDLHADDHPFLVFQLMGSKEWEHSYFKEKNLSSQGDVSFYPRGYLHKVKGLGELSIHLTIAFDSYAEDMSSSMYMRRSGTGLPYSLGVPVQESTESRLSLRKRSWEISDGKLEVNTGVSVLSLPCSYFQVLEKLYSSPSVTPRDVSDEFRIPIEEVLRFWDFSYENGLLFNSL